MTHTLQLSPVKPKLQVLQSAPVKPALQTAGGGRWVRQARWWHACPATCSPVKPADGSEPGPHHSECHPTPGSWGSRSRCLGSRCCRRRRSARSRRSRTGTGRRSSRPCTRSSWTQCSRPAWGFEGSAQPKAIPRLLCLLKAHAAPPAPLLRPVAASAHPSTWLSKAHHLVPALGALHPASDSADPGGRAYLVKRAAAVGAVGAGRAGGAAGEEARAAHARGRDGAPDLGGAGQRRAAVTSSLLQHLQAPGRRPAMAAHQAGRVAAAAGCRPCCPRRNRSRRRSRSGRTWRP